MIAMTIGTSAMSDPKTRKSTMSAPTPPSMTSTSTLGPLPDPSPLERASRPVMRMGAPATVCFAAAARAASSALPAASKPEAPGRNQTTANVVCPSRETKTRSPVVA